MPIPHGDIEKPNLGRLTGKLISASIAFFAASTVLSVSSYAGTIAPGDTVTIGPGAPAETWNVQNDATLNVTAGGHIQETGVFGTLNMDGATASSSGTSNGYSINVFGGNANIISSTLTGPGGLAVSSFFGAAGSAVVTDSTVAGTYQAVLVQHGSTLDMTGGTVKGGTNGFELINGADVTINGTTITSGGVGILAYAGSSTGAVGSKLRVRNATIESVGVGVDLRDGSNADIRDTEITTNGADGFGVRAFGSTADLTDTTISTENAHGIVVQGAGTVVATNVSVTTTGDIAHGATAIGAGSSFSALGGSYSTSGLNAAGIEARNGGHVVVGYDPRTGNGTSIHTTGNSAVGVLIQDGSSAEITGANIRTDGDHEQPYWSAAGILAVGGSSAVITDTVVTTTGIDAGGVVAEGAGSRFDMVRGSIHTTNEKATGAVAYGGGTANLTDVVIVAEKGRGITAGDAGSVLTMTGGSILAQGSGDEQSAVMAVRGATVNINNVSVNTDNDNARGLHAYNAGSIVNAAGSDVLTQGVGSHAAFASTGSTVNLTNSFLKTEGDAANGLMAKGGSTITASHSVILTQGNGSAGVSLAGDSAAVLEKTSVVSKNGPTLQTAGGNVSFDLKNGTQIVGENGTLLQAVAGSTTKLTADGDVVLSGDMIAEADDTMIDATLSNRTYWQGAAKNVTAVAIASTSHWLMTGSSDVGVLSNDGLVEFDAAAPYKTLTAGTLDVNGGAFILNTKLNEGGAASETDKIVVTGDANGDGIIHVRNNGGAGAATGTGATDGIQIIEVGGASNADFQLGSAAVVGIYDYQLKKADGQNWYLQTEGDDVVDPGEGEGDGGDAGTGHVVDIVPGYSIALAAAQNHVLTTIDTFHERLGELRADELQDGFHSWMRGIGKTGSYSPKSITGYNGHGFDMTTAGVQIGIDYSKGDVFIAGDKLTVGMFGEYANSSFDVRGRTADGSISSKGLGGYVTWQQKAPTDRKPGTGAYVDAVIKHDWLDFGVNAKSVSGFKLQNGYKGTATTASIEAGYGFDLGNNVVLQPQAQLIYSKINADSFTDAYGIDVYGQSAESVIGRVGVRLEKTFYFGDEEDLLEAAPVPAQNPQKAPKAGKGSKAKTATAVLPEAPKKKKFVKSVTTFADANAKHEFKGKNGLVAAGTDIGNDMSGTRYDVGVGVVARVSENVSLFGRGSVEFGGSTNVAGKVSGGLKITW